MMNLISAIPVMTSNTTPSGTVSAKSYYISSTQPWMAFDNNTNTGWTSKNAPPDWIEYDFGSDKTILKYAVTVKNTPNEPPKSWVFEGAKEDGVWVSLDEQNNITDWSSVNHRREFMLSNLQSFSKYRMRILTNQNMGYRVSIVELEMFELAIQNKILIKTDTSYVYYDTSTSTISQLNGVSEKNFIKYGMDSVKGFNSIFTNKNYILQDGVSKNENGYWTTKLDRKPLSIILN